MCGGGARWRHQQITKAVAIRASTVASEGSMACQVAAFSGGSGAERDTVGGGDSLAAGQRREGWRGGGNDRGDERSGGVDDEKGRRRGSGGSGECSEAAFSGRVGW